MSAPKTKKATISPSEAPGSTDLPFFAVVGRLYDEDDAAFVIQAKTQKQAIKEARKMAGATRSDGPGSFILAAIFDCGDRKPIIL